jgi:hypothetical protein
MAKLNVSHVFSTRRLLLAFALLLKNEKLYLERKL